jgi:hypothetical protein
MCKVSKISTKLHGVTSLGIEDEDSLLLLMIGAHSVIRTFNMLKRKQQEAPAIRLPKYIAYFRGGSENLMSIFHLISVYKHSFFLTF